MGMAHLVTVFEDALNFGKEKPEALVEALGRGVVKVCQDPEFMVTETGQERVRCARVLNHMNGVMHVDEIHSSQEQSYVWMGNCLRPLWQLSGEDLERAKAVFDKKYSERKATLMKDGK